MTGSRLIRRARSTSVPAASTSPAQPGRTTQVASANSTIAGPSTAALAQPARRQHRHLAPVAVEVARRRSPASASPSALLGGAAPACSTGTRRDHARVDDLDRLALHPVAVAALVRGVEALVEPVEVVGVDGQLERLAAVAQVGAAAQLGLVQVLARLLLHRRERLARRPRRRAAGARSRGAGRRSRARARSARRRRAARARVAIPSSSASAQACSPPAPPNATSAKSRGSSPRSTRDHPQRPAHLGVGDAHDAERGLERVEAELARRALAAPPRRASRRQRHSPPSSAPSPR